MRGRRRRERGGGGEREGRMGEKNLFKCKANIEIKI